MDSPLSPFAATHLVSTSTSRVTRSSARLAAETASTSSEGPNLPSAPVKSPTKPSSGRKRKAALEESAAAEDKGTNRRAKRVRVSSPEQKRSTPRSTAGREKKKAKAKDSRSAAMSTSQTDEEVNRRTSSSRRRQPSPPAVSAEISHQNAASTSSGRRKSSRKSGNAASSKSTPVAAPNRRSKRALQKKDFNTPDSHIPPAATAEEDDVISPTEEEAAEKDRAGGRSDEDGTAALQEDKMDEDDPFTSNLLGRMAGSSSISNTLRALGGMMSGVTSRLRGILENLRKKDDPSVQLVALTELSELLLISNEDNLAGAFPQDQFVKELVALMQPNDFGEENPEMMLLACRCIANLMEAIPSATASVVYGGAVPVLCQKLLEIHYIDLAEQALSTLEKISVEFPTSIVREGGLTACLTYLDFFATSTQRTAVTTAANCCRGIPQECFSVIKDVMPILLNVLSSNDQRVVEQGSLCVCRIIESFRWQDERLEELVSADLLKAILRLLLPGTTNLIGPSIHTHFLRVLAIASRASPRISAELLRLNVVDTLYQILTGVSPPSGTSDLATGIDKNVIMQALIRSPRDQIYETLNVICELLPSPSADVPDMKKDQISGAKTTSSTSKMSPNEKRMQLLSEAPQELRRFAMILFPTLMHAYTSTVNLNVRQKVLSAQLKMLSNFDRDVIRAALEAIPFASHVASILTQQEVPLLVSCALQIAEILLKRLPDIYRSQFSREGVIAEIKALASRPLVSSTNQDKEAQPTPTADSGGPAGKKDVAAEAVTPTTAIHDPEAQAAETMDEQGSEEDHDDEEGEDEETGSTSSDSEAAYKQEVSRDASDLITLRAQDFVQLLAAEGLGDDDVQEGQAADRLQSLGRDLISAYERADFISGKNLFQRLADVFSQGGSDGVTSYELLRSDIVDVLLQLFSGTTGADVAEARAAFFTSFMTTSNERAETHVTTTSSTPFSILLHKLQDLLSRTEHFEVVTVHQNAFESSRSSATSMLAKQLRLKLCAEEGSGIPKPYRNIMVSIHAIATFQALNDYLRPRLTLADQPDHKRTRDSLFEAAIAQAQQKAEKLLAAANQAGSSDEPASSAPDVTKAQTSPPAEPSDVSSRLRRSSRKLADADLSAGAPATPGPRDYGIANDSPLECADETKLSDDEEDSTDAGMDAVLDDFDDELDEMEEEPSAVNLEVANSGKVTARKEDGTRISTPQQQGYHGQSAAAMVMAARLQAAQLATPASLGRPMSYASAVQSTPQDWHIEFSINGQPLSNDMTIYRAVHSHQENADESASRVAWSSMHKISFKKVPGPPPVENKAQSPGPEASLTALKTLPASLTKDQTTAGILQLMSILHTVNDNLADAISPTMATDNVQSEPLTNFINTKLTAKLNRQLEEPLIVASNCLPSWAEDLARLYPFLFPFESRHLFLQSTSFGYSRSMARWQNGRTDTASRRHRDERPFLGRTQRQKVRISRTRILESALKVMELYGGSPSILEVEYFEEVGTGLGPTLEFYATISREFSKKKLKLWRENETDEQSEFAFGKGGLFPAPMSATQAENDTGKRVLQLFRLLGKFVARSMLDSRIIDISFNPAFFRIGNSTTVAPRLGALATVDQSLARSLRDLVGLNEAKRAIENDASLTMTAKIDEIAALRIKDIAVQDLGLDFTLPGYPDIELVGGGTKIDVTNENVEEYVQKVLDMTLGTGVQRQAEAFRAGFSEVFPYSALRAFTPDELVMLFGQVEEDWSLETLMDSIKADHGFNLDSASVRNLLQTMSEYGPTEQRDFLQFVTGSPKLPIGGFKSLTPMFTVVCKPSEPPLTPDDYLPSVMTCVNYLKMPNYTSLQVLREKLAVAIKEGQGAFHLS